MHNKFNESFRKRTKAFAIQLVKFYMKLENNDLKWVIGKQLLRSGTSVAANFRASCRARSDKEYFAKLCIVVEEADETLFWFEIMEESGLIKHERIAGMMAEISELLFVFSSLKKKLKNK
jgi:four helix bundle protein